MKRKSQEPVSSAPSPSRPAGALPRPSIRGESLSPSEERDRILHELGVYRAELEAQNDQLRQVQMDLEASRARYCDLYDRAPVGYCTVSEDGMIAEANLTAAALLGVPRSAMIGRPFYGFIFRDDRDTYYFFRQRLHDAQKPIRCELRLLPQTGEPFWGSLEAMMEHAAGGSADFRVIMADISERKRVESEKARLEEQLHHAQKMEAIGTLAGGVAHDFNNILGSIMASLSMLELNPGIDVGGLGDIQNMKGLVRRGADLTKQLLGFARGGKYESKVLDLARVIDATTDMFSRTHRDITIHRELASNLQAVLMDQNQLEQVLLNLFLNAAHAMADGGRLTLRANNVTVDEVHAKVRDVKPGHFVELVVADTGVGMDEPTRIRAFEPFFTTKPLGHGTGLGLASAYGIIKNHHGNIAVESAPGTGTRFTILMPATDAKPSIRAAATKAPQMGGECILIVDDEEIMLKVTARLLRALGYQVLMAASGREAIDLVRAHKGELSLVILDMIMPEMSGAKTFEVLHEMAPGLKVLLASGYAVDGQAQEILDRGCTGFIQKPFDIAALSTKVRSLLGQPEVLPQSAGQEARFHGRA